MIKKICILLIVIANVVEESYAQTNVYHPFPDSNAVWRVDNNYNPCDCPGNCVSSCGYNEQYSMQGDTTKGIYTYHKIYQSYQWFQYNVIGPVTGNFYAGIRQDVAAKKVYCFLPGTNDTLLYDFNMHIGDTLKGYLANFTFIVTAIDSIKIGIMYRKRINFNCCNQPPAIIEGIGSVQGLFYVESLAEAGSDLVCFMQNGKTLYPDTNTNCPQYLLGTKKIDVPQTTFNIYPNPASTSLQVSLSGSSINSIEIYNAIGECVYRQIATSSNCQINVADLSEGIYTVLIKNAEVKTNKRLVIAR